MYRIRYIYRMNNPLEKIISAKFYRTPAGNEPVLDWLKGLNKEDRKTIGNDIRTVEMGWPIGMPVCRKLEGHSGLREVRSEISDGCIARIIFYINGNEMILLHGFVKKDRKIPKSEIDLAINRKKEHEKHE